MLDFGCGWGRLTRFFLRDVAPGNLVGVDIDERAVAAARATNHWCRFDVSSVLPPSSFPDASFDLIYAYSVFSHLSEEAHLRWLQEFARILSPSGVLLVTTLGRGFVERNVSRPAKTADLLAGYGRSAAQIFAGSGDLLQAYDRGEYCYRAIDPDANPHFGFAAIPERYVREHWARHLTVRRWIEKPAPDLQTVNACARPVVEGARSDRDRDHSIPPT